MVADLESVQSEEEALITVTGKSGGKKTVPVWFTVHRGVMELLPMYGSKTKWLASVEQSKTLKISVAGISISSSPRIVRDPAVVDEIKERFATKYARHGDVGRYYPTSEVALLVAA